METHVTSALVVGGSLVGLSTALFLAQHGVPTVLVERHPGSSPHPRAIGYTARTLELFRSVGLGPSVPQAPAHFRLLRARAHSLAGEWFEQTSWHPQEQNKQAIEYSPCTGAAIAQDRLEPLLRERARELGADLRLGTEFLSFEQDADGVTARLRDGNRQEYAVRAAYLIAADGARSEIRNALGIGRNGRGPIRTLRSVLFRAPLQEYLARGVMQFDIDQPDFKAFLTTYNDGRWVLMFPDDTERDESMLRAAVFKAIGRPDLNVEIITTGRWELSALIADRFVSDRVILAGDAAHTLPPTRGGYGANTGIQDAHNLAWKLAAVLRGSSTPDLIETYDAERRPVAWLRHQQTFARPDYRSVAAGCADDEPIIDDEAIEFGEIYRSGAIVGADGALPPALRPEQWAGQPGTRAPHLWVTVKDQQRSTLDWFGEQWILLAEDVRWCAAADQIAESSRLRLKCIRVGADAQLADLDIFRKAFGLSPQGASLVRPDGYIAWRAVHMPDELSRVLRDAIERASFCIRVPTAARVKDIWQGQ